MNNGNFKQKERKKVKAFRGVCGTTLSAEWLPVQLRNKDPPVLHSLIQPTIHATNIHCVPRVCKHNTRHWEDSGNKVNADPSSQLSEQARPL